MVLLASACAASPQSAYAAEVTIKLGNTAPYSGPASAYGTIARAESAYFQMLNDQGGINGRRIEFLTLDDGYSPAKTVEQTRKLVEDDGVFADVGTVGTTPNSAIQKYLNQNQVPHVFVSAGGRRFNDPKNFPWSVPMYPAFEMEGKTFGNYIIRNKSDAKIAVLYQNDDYGKDFLTGLKAALEKASPKIIAEASYELTDPTIDSQIVKLKDSGADVLMDFSTPKFAAQTLKKTTELDWHPAQFLVSPTNSVAAVLKPAGLENVQGVYTTQFTKQAGDPAWAEDPEVKEYIAFMKKWTPNDNPGDFVALSGYINAQAIAYGLERCGDDLTRENFLKQALSFNGQRFKMMLPGVELNNSADDHAPYQSLRMARFEGSSWKLIDDSATSKQTSTTK